jgi:hypothetical protein
MAGFEDSKRAKAFRRELIAEIPRFPNDRASLAAMNAKSLTDLLITYIGWRLRYVAPKPRAVSGQTILAGHPRAADLKANLDAFLQRVEQGDDLTPHLSLLPHTKGYTPAADPQQAGTDNWADKDFLLNVMGIHHFHLGLTTETAGHSARTDEILFASVSRNNFEILGLFDHSAFETNRDTNDQMTAERSRLWQVFEAREQAQLLPGQYAVGGYAGRGLTLSGQPLAVVQAAQAHLRIMQEVEPKLDDPSFLATIYPSGSVPAKPTLRWRYRHLDFGVADDKASVLGVFSYGPN